MCLGKEFPNYVSLQLYYMCFKGSTGGLKLLPVVTTESPIGLQGSIFDLFSLACV